MPLPTARPLVVDLDGTLCRTDTLWESFFAAWRVCWWLPFAAALWLLRGRQLLKLKVAALALPDVAHLPWNPAVLSALQAARAQGRACVLATAANERIAHACAESLGGFDRVLASTETLNLKGAAKAQLLVQLYGAQGFDYIGDSRADLPVWAQAAHKISVTSVLPPEGERLSGTRSSHTLAAWAKELRVRHWVKNILVFVALVAAHRWAYASAWQAAALSFVAFCCVCSGVYIINDLFDLAADRAHPTKQRRPLASGQPLFARPRDYLYAPLAPRGICC